jgi:hypothetical protein
MRHPLAILISACVASAAFVGWRVHAMRTLRVDHYAVVWDRSLSYGGGCPSLVGPAEAALLNPNVSDRSTISIFVSGASSTAREPRRLASSPIPTSRKVMEGQRARFERQTALLRELQGRCKSIRPTSISPIFLAVKQAIADLRAEGCKEGSQCELWVSSDLQENGVRAIKERLDGAPHTREPLPAPLENAGINVTLCGFAETAGHLVDPSGREIRGVVARDPRRDDRLQAVWRALFSKPDLVGFEPYCPASSLVPPDRVHPAREHVEAELYRSSGEE